MFCISLPQGVVLSPSLPGSLGMLVKNIDSNLTLDLLNQNLQICILLIYIFNNTQTAFMQTTYSRI